MADLRVTRQVAEVIASDPLPVQLLAGHSAYGRGDRPPTRRPSKCCALLVRRSRLWASDAPSDGTYVGAETDSWDHAIGIMQSCCRPLDSEHVVAHGQCHGQFFGRLFRLQYIEPIRHRRRWALRGSHRWGEQCAVAECPNRKAA